MRLFALGVACLCLAGCAAAAAGVKVDEFELAEYRAVVALSAADLAKPDGPAPNKPLRKDCKVCNGTGKVRSGDGLHIFDCNACLPPLVAEVNLSELPADDEIAFGDDEPRTLRTEQLCPCDSTGLCYCSVCECPTERTRVAYLYSKDDCPGCETAKAVIKAAAESGTLPADIRVVVRCGKDVPAWVKAFPTLHYECGGRWLQTHHVARFLRDCKGPDATEVPFGAGPGTVYLGTYGPAGCSSGSCYGGSGVWGGGSFYGGSCSSGSCGSWGGGFSRPYFGGGFRGGFSGGGCSSCR